MTTATNQGRPHVRRGSAWTTLLRGIDGFLGTAVVVGAMDALWVLSRHGWSFDGDWRAFLVVWVFAGTLWLPVGLAGGGLAALLAWWRPATGRFGLGSGVGLAGLLGLALMLVGGPEQGPKVTPPPAPDAPFQDILLVSLDTLRPDQLGCYGNPDAYTPVLDELARRGVQLGEGVTPIPRTGPAHGSMLSGLHPLHHGARANSQPIRRDVPLLQERLRGRGYQSAAFVSGWTLKDRESGLARGFDHYDDTFAPSPFPSDEAAQLWIVKQYARLGLLDWTFWMTVERPAHRTTDRFTSYWRDQGQAPHFVLVHYFDPHTPYFEHPPLMDLFDFPSQPVTTHRGVELDAGVEIARYYNETAFTDIALGEMLREVSPLEETLLIVTADHGESLTEHDYYFEHGQNLYRQSLEVPGIVVAPGKVPQGRLVEGRWSLLDLKPTILGLLDIDGPELPGINLTPSLQTGSALPERPLFAETNRMPYLMTGGRERRLEAVHLGPWKLIQREEGEPELFNLIDDPAESANRFAEAPDVAQRLQQLLLDHRKGAADAGPITVDPASRERLKALGYIND